MLTFFACLILLAVCRSGRRRAGDLFGLRGKRVKFHFTGVCPGLFAGAVEEKFGGNIARVMFLDQLSGRVVGRLVHVDQYELQLGGFVFLVEVDHSFGLAVAVEITWCAEEKKRRFALGHGDVIEVVGNDWEALIEVMEVRNSVSQA